MAERSGPWDLLGVDRDPVVADVVAIDERVSYFRSLAEAMREQGDRLSRIASGQALSGAYADELRGSADQVAKDLTQVVGRYEAVVTALTQFRPAVHAALTGSRAALDDAIDASGASRQAESLPEAVPQPDAELTPEQEQANADRASAVAAAAERVAAAKAKLNDVLARFDEAGAAAARVVRSGFGDGLTDSWVDRFVAAFKKFLKILVQVLTYIGMALAVLAVIIPGVGPLILAGAIIGVVALVAEVALMALGEGSWVDLGIAIAGVLTLGAAKLFGPSLKSGFRATMASLRNRPRVRPPSPTPRPATPDAPSTPRPATPDAPTPRPATPDAPTPRPATPDAPTPRPATPDAPPPRPATPDAPPPRPATPDAIPAPAPAPLPQTVGRWRPKRRDRPTEELPPDLNKLDPDEILSPEADAMHKYLGGGATPMNRYLRGLDGPANPARDAEADLVSAELKKLPPLDEAVTFRGVNVDLSNGLKPGDTFVDPGFVSTSLSRTEAQSFVVTGGELNGRNTSGVGTVFQFESRGTGRDVKPLTTTGEHEVLFDRGTPFQVVDVRNANPVPDGRGGFIQVREVILRTPDSVPGGAGGS